MEETIMVEYNRWLHADYIDGETKEEIQQLQDFPEQLKDAFYKCLEFGTAGARGIVGPGPNRMNKYTVRRITQGYAQFLKQHYGYDAYTRGIVIAYDNRHYSKEFALEVARTLAANKINAYLFSQITTTPELSYAVRYLKTVGGVVITASHNPSQYNGYKVYDETGYVMVPELAEQLVTEIQSIQGYDILVANKEDEHIHLLDTSIDEDFLNDELKVLHHPKIFTSLGEEFKVLYTPLHGTGRKPVLEGLAKLGLKKIYTVEEQLVPDPEFSTVELPNPEDAKAFTLALEVARKEDISLLLATDPDCDRVGVMVRTSKGKYQALNGNQIGALVIYYLLSTNEEWKKQPKPYIASSIVSSDLGEVIAKDFGVESVRTLTGFKYIGEQMNQRLKNQTFIMGYEESYGFLVSLLERDKDGVSASFVLAEMVAYYWQQGKTLVDVLHELDERYGYYREALVSLTLPGQKGMDEIQALMQKLRHLDLENKDFIHQRVDYLKDETGLPKADVLQFILENQAKIFIRPSGTEPKIKFYIGVCGSSKEEAQEKIRTCQQWIQKIQED